MGILQRHFCNVFTMSEEGKGITTGPGGRLWGRCFHNGQPHWLNLSSSLGKLTLSWVAWEKFVSGVSVRGKEISCTVDDVHDICSFVSGLVVLRFFFVCLFVWGLNDF